MVFDLGDGRERNLHDLPVRDLHLHAGRGEGLSRLHAPHCSSHAPAVRRDDFHVVFAIKRLECCEGFGDFHSTILLISSQLLPLCGGKSIQQPNATGKHYLAYRTCPCILRVRLRKGGSGMSQVSETVCSNCHSTMPAELRFCRNCGFRLTGSTGAYTGSPYPSTAVAESAAGKKKRRLSGMSWIFVGLLVFFVGAAAFTALIAPMRKASNIVQRAAVVKSYIGVDGFTNTDQGVAFDAITTPGGPADQAGLVGGDVILSFDGQPIHDEDQIEELMTKTPVGKTVDIEYLRDGQKKTAKLTTISQEDNKRLTREFERRPEGRAHFGYEDGDAERVQVPGSNLYGVKLGTILRSRPADLAGVKEGDIVTAFDGIPIRTSDELLMRVRRALPYSTVTLSIVRKGENESDPIQKLEIPVKMGKQ